MVNAGIMAEEPNFRRNACKAMRGICGLIERQRMVQALTFCKHSKR